MRQDGPEREKDIAMGFLLGLVFLITSLRMLMGTWSLPSSFGEFLNLVLHHITTVYPLVHDYFTEPEGSSLVFVLITIMALFGFYDSDLGGGQISIVACFYRIVTGNNGIADCFL